MDDGPDTRKGHDSQANPAEDSHVDYSPDYIQNQGCKVNVIGDLSLIHSFIGFGLFFVLGVHADGYRAVVEQLDLHVSAEFSCAYRFAYCL